MINIESDKAEVIRFLYYEFYQQSEYIKQKDAKDANFDPHFEAGILFAYSEVLDTIRRCAVENRVNLEDFFERNIKPYDVIEFRPKNWPKDTRLI